MIEHTFDRVVRRLHPRRKRLHYAVIVLESTVEEQAELVALLRERPGGRSWI
jgi:hypothetical protein